MSIKMEVGETMKKENMRIRKLIKKEKPKITVCDVDRSRMDFSGYFATEFINAKYLDMQLKTRIRRLNLLLRSRRNLSLDSIEKKGNKRGFIVKVMK